MRRRRARHKRTPSDTAPLASLSTAAGDRTPGVQCNSERFTGTGQKTMIVDRTDEEENALDHEQ
jgi:hypothetical protein